jgi:hypothetical protein
MALLAIRQQEEEASFGRVCIQRERKGVSSFVRGGTADQMGPMVDFCVVVVVGRS